MDRFPNNSSPGDQSTVKKRSPCANGFSIKKPAPSASFDSSWNKRNDKTLVCLVHANSQETIEQFVTWLKTKRGHELDVWKINHFNYLKSRYELTFVQLKAELGLNH